jgi:hypothetical protein
MRTLEWFHHMEKREWQWFETLPVSLIVKNA